MSFILRSLRGILRRPPVVIFIVLALGSCLAGYGFVYWILSANLHGDYLLLKNEYLEVEFPRYWFAFTWKPGNETSGRGYSAFFAPTDRYVVMLLRIYDEVATRRFIEANNLTDAFSVAAYEADRMYNWSLQSNANATFLYSENGTVTVASREAIYTKFAIRDGFKQDEAFYNLTCIFMSWIDKQQLFEIAFWGKEDDWTQTHSVFETMLGSIKI